MSWELYDYLDNRGINQIKSWTQGLEDRLRGKLNLKLDLLELHGTGLSTGLLSDTKIIQIKELVINGRVAMRPMLCLGPTRDHDGRYNQEFTILCGAFEKDSKYIPKNALTLADKRREEVIKEPNIKRCPHEQVD